PEDEDLFLPMNSGPLEKKRVRLRCSLGRWQNRPAYSVDLWENPEWESRRNMSGPVVQLLGHPFAPRGRSGGTVLALWHFCAGSSCQCAAAVVRTICKKDSPEG